MILERVDLQQLCAQAVRKRQPIAGGAVMIARGEALDVQPPNAAGCQNHGLGGHSKHPIVVQIPKHGARADAVAVAQQLNRRTELQQLDFLIEYLVLQDPHQLQPRIVRTGQQSGLGASAAFLDVQVAVRVPIEQNPQPQQPTGNRRSLFHHHLQELMVVLHVPTFEGVQKMLDGRIFVGDRDLHAPLSHNRIGIAES